MDKDAADELFVRAKLAKETEKLNPLDAPISSQEVEQAIDLKTLHLEKIASLDSSSRSTKIYLHAQLQISPITVLIKESFQMQPQAASPSSFQRNKQTPENQKIFDQSPSSTSITRS
jgi:hypothetical protein